MISQSGQAFFISIDDDIVDKTFKVEKIDALAAFFSNVDGRQTAWWFMVGQAVSGTGPIGQHCAGHTVSRARTTCIRGVGSFLKVGGQDQILFYL